MGVGLPVLHLCTLLHLSALPTHLDMASLITWLLDFHTAQFSDDSRSYLFCSLDVIFGVVGQGGNPCYLCLYLDWESEFTTLNSFPSRSRFFLSLCVL